MERTAAPLDRVRGAVRRAATDPTAALWAGVAVLAVLALFRLEALPAGTLTHDPGIRFHLAGLTADGAVPIRDFEHGWNAGGWYIGAALWWLVAGQPALWHWAFTHLAGFFLAGALVLVVLRRVGAPPAASYAYLGGVLALGTIPHGKYAIPVIWALALLPVGRGLDPRRAVGLRALLGAATALVHLDLALMLIVGTGAYDLVIRRDLRWRRRLLYAVTPGLAAGLAFLGEVAVYDGLVDGITGGELVEFLLLERGQTIQGINFDFPLLDPPRAIYLLYPASLLLPLIPAVWRRLAEPTRFLAVLHLALSLTAIRKPDLNHVLAASVLLLPVAILAVRDVAADRGDAGTPEPSPRPRWRWLAAVLGVVWFAAGVVLAFRVPSLGAWAAVVAFGVVTAVIADRLWRPGAVLTWMGVGAAGAAAALIAVGLIGHTVRAVADESDPQARHIADAVADDLAPCLNADREALVVRWPLALYDDLDVHNPTPFYLFWDGFDDQRERFERLAGEGRIPTIIQIDAWPPGFKNLQFFVDDTYRLCHEERVAATGTRVRVWVHPDAATAFTGR